MLKRQIKKMTRKTIDINGYEFSFNSSDIMQNGNTISNKTHKRKTFYTNFYNLDGEYYSEYLEYGVYVYAVDKNNEWFRINSHKKELIGSYKFAIVMDPYHFLDLQTNHICKYSEENNAVFAVKLSNNKNKTNGPQISVVTASYNSAAYLDDYFSSLANTKYEDLEIIFVDDGSSDNTAEIVEKYKNNLNINYIYQENTGQATARNNGIKHINSEWVTFIDSDDFVDENYFEEAMKSLNINSNAGVIICNQLFFYEGRNTFSDAHPLRHRFGKFEKFKAINLLEEKSIFHLHAGSTFFKAKEIKKYNIEFPNLKPIFEDSFFLNEYIRLTNNYDIILAKSAKFYYRKRQDGSSTLDKMLFDRRVYVDLLKDGYLALMNNFGDTVPDYIQNMVLYDLNWRFKSMENLGIILEEEDRILREEYLQQIFDKINFENLKSNANLKYYSLEQKIMINNRYYNNQYVPNAAVYLSYDTPEYRKLLLISTSNKWSFTHNGKNIKIADGDFAAQKILMNGTEAATKYYVKIPREGVKVYFEGREMYINNNKTMPYKEWLNKKSICLFFDSPMRASDNAEAFYNYFKENKPEYKNIYFVISKESKDYNRLEMQGFNMVDYGSEEFKELYKEANYIFSSDMIEEIENHDRLRHSQKSWTKARFIFLQHGITSDDMTRWFARKKIDYIIAGCNFEYENLTTRYHYFKNEVLLTGFPRFDLLKNLEGDFITVMFTWRSYFENYTEEEFINTQYYKNMIALITSPKIMDALEKKNMKIHLVLHARMNKFLHLFTQYESKQIIIMDITKMSFVEEISKSKMVVTDYSSIHFDFGYLNKKVILFQEDAVEFYANHTYEKEENYQYDRDGLGKVTYNFEDLNAEILSAFANNFVNEDIYTARVNKAFKYTDNNNRERLFNVLSDNNDKLGLDL